MCRNTIAPIFTSPEGVFLQTIYHPLRLYAEHTREIALDVATVDGETYDLPPAQETGAVGRVHHVADLGPFTLLDATATCDPDGRALTLAVVNRDRARSHAATIDLGDAAVAPGGELAEVNGADVEATNDFAAPRRVDVQERRLDAGGRRIEHVFPAHSVSMLRLRVAQ